MVASVASAAQAEAQFFDDLVRHQGDFNPFAPRGWRTLSERFAQMLHPAEHLDILDVGCGTGQSRRIYTEWAGNYTGIDLSEQALAIARRNHPFDRWLAADACELPFEEASFDVVAFSSVLHHIPDFSRALAEARRVLRPGGACFAFDPNLLHPAMLLFRWPKSPLYRSRGVSPNESPLLPGHLRREFATAGLVKIEQRAQANIPYRQVAPRVLNACLSAYNAADWCWDKCGLGRWFGTFVLTVGRKPADESRGPAHE